MTVFKEVHKKQNSGIGGPASPAKKGAIVKLRSLGSITNSIPPCDYVFARDHKIEKTKSRMIEPGELFGRTIRAGPRPAVL